MGGDWLRTDGKIHSEQNSNLHSSLDVAEVLTAILSLVEFEQHGEDRAKYGEKLLSRLADRLNRMGFNLRRLRDYRHVYQVYPYLGVEVVKFLNSNSAWLSNDSHITNSAVFNGRIARPSTSE